MSEDEELNLFESVIHITEERDKRSLEKSLIETLSDFINFESLILLRIPPHSDNELLEVASSIPTDAYQSKLNIIPTEYGDQRVKQDVNITQCIDKNEVILDNKNSLQRTLFPIAVNDVVTGVLDIYGYDKAENTDKLIVGFLRIYSNFLAIINDNEHDTLTGLLNRKTFDAQLSFLLSNPVVEKNNISSTNDKRRADKADNCNWIGIFDIDHFKKINDNFGHMYGDEVLLLFANLMEKTFRNSDLLFRYGGEEFVVVLAPTTESDALMVFDRFRKKLQAYKFPQVGRITVSIGMVNVHDQEHPTTLVEHADQALYYAKEHGRNQVCNYDELIKTGTLKVRQIESDIDLF